MAYNNYGPPPGAYGAPQSSYRPPVPGMGPPPPFGASPGMEAPPGMAAQSPAGMQGQFPTPANFANLPFNTNSPVIRLEMHRPDQSSGGRTGGDRGGRDGRGSNAEPMGNRNRSGLGADPRDMHRERLQIRETMIATQPPTREEVSRTIFIGGLGEGYPTDSQLENLLRCAGKLRKWTRARDADDKKCKFGFAEFEDVESLEAAAELFPGLEVPLFNHDGSVKKEEVQDEIKIEDSETKELRPTMAPLLVVVDEQSKEYIDQWMGRKKEDESQRQFRMETCKEELQQAIAGLSNQAAHAINGTHEQQNGDRDGEGPIDEANGDRNTEVVAIPQAMEDDLVEIPAEAKATIAEEIKAFRDRANRRDNERLRVQEEAEQEERRRSGAPRPSRLASPPASVSTSNGIPVGPRGQQGVQGAPSGPRGFRGAQLPSDYVNGVTFVSGIGFNGTSAPFSINREDENAEESDEELERRRKEKKDAEKEKKYTDLLRRWQNRERQRGSAQERERQRAEIERQGIEHARENMRAKLASWKDDDDAERTRYKYYGNRQHLSRTRKYERDQERREDALDRKAEEAEEADKQRRQNVARGMADDFLGSMGLQAAPKPAEQPSGFVKISLGGAAAKTKQAQAASSSKRAMADVEGLLEDEEDAVAAGLKRPELKPLQDTSTVPTSGQDLTDEEKANARHQLASEIPIETDVLFEQSVKWDSVSNMLLKSQIRPFVERKVVDYLGVQEELIVDVVMDGLRDRRKPKDIVEELEGPLEDEAEALVKKVWRLLVFWSECENRGLSS